MEKQDRGKILLAVDGSEYAFEAVRYVSRLPPFKTMEVVLFNVLNVIPEAYWDIGRHTPHLSKIREVRAWQKEEENKIQEYMDKSKKMLWRAGFPKDVVKVKIQERKKGVARDIIREAKRGYSCVIVGRKGMSRLRNVALGTVTAKLLEKITFIPLFVVGRCKLPVKILLALSGSESSMRRVDYVGRLLFDCDCDVHLIHVIRSGVEALSKRIKSTMDSQFSMAKSHLMKCGFDAHQISSKIITGVRSRAGAIAKEAKDGGYCMIVVVRRQESRANGFFIGGVSNKVVQLGREKVVLVVN